MKIPKLDSRNLDTLPLIEGVWMLPVTAEEGDCYLVQAESWQVKSTGKPRLDMVLDANGKIVAWVHNLSSNGAQPACYLQPRTSRDQKRT